MENGSSSRARALAATQDGFTYLGLLILMVIIGIGLAAIGPVTSTLQLRSMEGELLFAGDQFRRAIQSYYEKSPGLRQYPKKLEDLLRDNRYPGVQRYLRKIYPDPMTGGKEWGLVEIPGVGITGVYSTSEAEPIRKTNFPVLYRSFENAKKYSEWKFVYVPGQATGVPASASPAPQPQATAPSTPPASPAPSSPLVPVAPAMPAVPAMR